MRLIAILLMIMVPATGAKAGFLFDPVSVHPAKPEIGQPILLLVRSYWNDGCGGSMEVHVTPSKIDMIQIPRRVPGTACSAALQGFDAVINPQDRMDSPARFANRVEVRLFKRNFDLIDELLDTDIVEFASAPPSKSNISPGSFSAPTLAISGLFIDEQEGVISTLLSDYDDQGRSSWRFGAGKMHGDVYIGDLSRFQQIRCVTAPCPRAIADAVGKINLIALNANELFVSYRNAVSADMAGIATHHYERLIFNRPSALPDAYSADAWIPDLLGEWLVGVTGTRQENAEFKRYYISYIGKPTADPSSFDRRFKAESATNPTDFFEFICRDDSPLDGELGCRLNNYRALLRICDASFVSSDVTLGNLRIPAQCDSIKTEFVMQRLGR